jgi:hypothetical protein
MDLRHYRKAGSTGGFMTLNDLEMQIPGAKGSYTGKIEGWVSSNIEGYIEFFKPEKCRLLPHADEFLTFGMLDYFGEIDPYFYFGWALRSDTMPPYGYRCRATVAYMGVNYPSGTPQPPDWTEIPSQPELFKLMQPSAPPGDWKLIVKTSGFTVDQNVGQESHIAFHVWEGRSVWHKGLLDFVPQYAHAVGEAEVDWSNVDWGNLNNPGDLLILSGAAKGMHFRVVGKQYTGSNPPYGYPPDTWLILTHPLDPFPSAVGVEAGDLFRVVGPFNPNIFHLVGVYNIYGPGSYEEMEFEMPFKPLL